MKKTDIELVINLQNGEENAYNELYERYEKHLFFIAMRLTNNKGDAEDAVQETFIQVQRSIQQLKNPAYLKLWLHRIVAGKSKDIFRRNKSVPVDMSDEKVHAHYQEERIDFLPDRNMRFSNDREVMNYYIDKLPYLQREVVLLAYFDQLSMQEIADVTDASLGTVKSRLFLAKKTLRTNYTAYESREHTHIDFHAFNLEALITASMLESFHIFTNGKAAISLVSLVPKLKSFFISEVGKVTMSAVAIGLATTSVVAYEHMQSQKNVNEVATSTVLPNTIIKVNNRLIESEQEAYFVLMNWAMNEKHLQLHEEIESKTYLALYEYLQDQKGAYWNSLTSSGFDKVIEKKLK